MNGSATSKGGHFGPRSNSWKARFGEYFGGLANEDFFGFVDLRWETLNTVNESGEIYLVGFGTKRVKERLGFEMVVLEGVDSNLESAFEGRAVGANVEINTFDSGH